MRLTKTAPFVAVLAFTATVFWGWIVSRSDNAPALDKSVSFAKSKAEPSHAIPSPMAPQMARFAPRLPSAASGRLKRPVRALTDLRLPNPELVRWLQPVQESAFEEFRRWTETLSAPDVDLEKGIELAQQRRAELLDLIDKNPKRALELAMTGDPIDARTAAEGLVTAALVQPIFKQLRESAGAAPPPFGPGPGERSFRGMLDTTMAQKLVTSQNWPLVDRLARDLLNRSGTGPPLTNPPAKSSSQSTPLPVLTSSDAAR
jgi:hypothetical protein